MSKPTKKSSLKKDDNDIELDLLDGQEENTKGNEETPKKEKRTTPKKEKNRKRVSFQEESGSKEKNAKKRREKFQIPPEELKQRKIGLNCLLSVVSFLVVFVIIYFIQKRRPTKPIKIGNISLIKVSNYDELSEKAGEIIYNIIKNNPKANLGLATGSSPIGLYKYLINKYKNKEISFKDINTFNLDEYCNLPLEHKESYYSFMHKNLFDQVDINPNQIHIPSGLGNLEENCNKYNALLAENKLDIQLLGIGSNGHIGFNEPGTSMDSKTHIVNLTKKTREDNKRFFDGKIDDVPKQAITMGIANILDAKKILLIASGSNKAKAIQSLIEGEIDKDVPASSLKAFKGEVIVVADEAACSLLSSKYLK